MTAGPFHASPRAPADVAARRWPAAVVFRLIVLYAAAFAVGATIVFGRRSPPEGAQVVVRAAFTADASASREPEPLELPHRCRRVAETAGCTGVYRMTFRYDATDAEPVSVYVPTFNGRILIRVNDELLIDSRRVQTGAVINQAGPIIATIPASVLRRGDNAVAIRLETWDRSGGFLDRVVVGPDGAVRSAYVMRELALGTLPRLLAAWQAALCLSLFIVWLGRREDRVYLAMSAILGFGALQGAPLFLFALDWSDWTLRFANLAGVWQVSLLPGVMAGLVGWRPPAPTRWMLVAPLAFTLGYLVVTTDPATFQPWFGAAWVVVAAPWCVALLGWSAGIVVVAAFRRRHAAAQSIFAALIVVMMMAGHDMLAFVGTATNSPPLFSRFAGPLLMTVVSATLMWRFAMALTEVGRFNVVLREEVAAAEAALRASFKREAAQNRAAALESERLRLTRDLHDGLAGQLVSIVAQCELPTRDYRHIGEAARRALDDLRLVVASLDDVGDDLAMMLAQFHERIEPQLRAQGVALDWRMAPLPDVAGLRSEHALTLFRILQEAVTNAVRHSGCPRVAISMAPAPAERPDYAVRIVVSDRGRGGFSDRPGGRGLGNMRRRAAAMGAAFAIETGEDGSRVVMDLPHTLPDIPP